MAVSSCTLPDASRLMFQKPVAKGRSTDDGTGVGDFAVEELSLCRDFEYIGILEGPNVLDLLLLQTLRRGCPRWFQMVGRPFSILSSAGR